MKKILNKLSKTGTLTLALGLLLVAVPAGAHQDPAACDSNGVGLSIGVFRADGTTPVGSGTVQSGETIKYQATLSHLGGTNCNFEGGTLTITTPDSVAHIVASPATPVVPLVSSGSPFVSSQVSYVVSELDAPLSANANYSGGESHTDTVHDVAGANVDKATNYQDVALEVTKTAEEASETS